MSWGYVAVAAGTVIGGALSSRGARSAGNAAARGADAATAETARQYDQTRADLSSGRSLYEGANRLLGQLYGIPVTSASEFEDQQDVAIGNALLPAGTTSEHVGKNWYAIYNDIDGDGQKDYIGNTRPGGASGIFTPAPGVDIDAIRNSRRQTQQSSSAPTSPNMSGFFTSPDYGFRRDEGLRGIERTAAARGGAFSGNALRALNEFNSNLASTEYGNYFNRLTTMAGLGSAATSQTAAYGAQAAGDASRNALYAGDARASGIQGSANAWGNTLQDLGGLYGYYSRNRSPVNYIDMNSLPKRI